MQRRMEKIYLHTSITCLSSMTWRVPITCVFSFCLPPIHTNFIMPKFRHRPGPLWKLFFHTTIKMLSKERPLPDRALCLADLEQCWLLLPWHPNTAEWEEHKMIHIIKWALVWISQTGMCHLSNEICSINQTQKLLQLLKELLTWQKKEAP